MQAWALYDFANTIFSMNVLTMYFAQWIVLDRGMESLWYSGAYSLSMAFVALTLPVLGTMSDAGGGRMRYLLVFTIACVAATAALGPISANLPARTGALVALGVFVVANYAFQGGLVFYNALLPALAPPERIGLVSGFGVCLGYAGAVAGLLVALPFVERALLPESLGAGRAAAFLPTALAFALFAVPIFLIVKDAKRRSPRPSIRAALAEVREGLTDVRRYPGVRTFLIANFLLVDAISTAIIYMAVYAQVVMGMGDRAKIPLFIVSTSSAAVGSLLAGRACDRWGARRAFTFVFAGWTVTLLLLSVTKALWLFWVLGSAVGIFLGGAWTVSRPLLAQLVPAESHGRFFGLYALADKSASIVGPLVWGIIVWVLRDHPVERYRVALAALALFVASGWIVFRLVPDPSKRATAPQEAVP